MWFVRICVIFENQTSDCDGYRHLTELFCLGKSNGHVHKKSEAYHQSQWFKANKQWALGRPVCHVSWNADFDRKGN